MEQSKFLFSSIFLVVLALAAGLFTVGGPTTGRDQKLDSKRLSDIRLVANRVSCTSGVRTGSTLPVDINERSLQKHCNWAAASPNLTDPQSNQPYLYIRKNDKEFSICADFKDAKYAIGQFGSNILSKNMSFDIKTGCVNSSL